ncbi:MAG TPA: PQQ-binding-like beta-propeller repeat protein [Vicinamibacterales bacterium]|nr:PQQ-binding-like beta-propeller repeat protein [Vicinamibacterales bacterium]
MKRIALRVVPAVALLVAGFAWVGPRVSGQGYMPSTKNGDWTHYTADHTGSKYSPLDQVNASNFSKMEVAWRFKTDNLGPRPENKLQGTPLAIKGMLYTTAGTRRAVVALDGKTGEQKWMYAMDEGERATRWAPRQLSGRGVSYWTDGKGDERIFYVTTGFRLVALNAKTGMPIQNFADKGVVDLKVGIMMGRDGKQVQIDLEKGEIGLHSTPTVVGDIVIIGSSMFEGLGYLYSTGAKGNVRAYDVRTGKMVWKFETMPGPGQPGHETWENGSWAWTGNTGVWTQITADPVAGLAYLPVETPTIDEYGGNRLGDNLYAESLVAVDLKTGQRKWHFQFVHHPIWDHDMSSAPLLMDVTIDGKPRKIVAVPSKQGWLYCFDRITGVPIWPIEERPVPQTDMPGEKTAKTQPFPTKPAPYARTHVSENDLIDFTPALRAKALENLKLFRWEQIPYVPPVGPNSKSLGAINIANTAGGTNWPGSGFDPETGWFYTQAGMASVTSAKYDEEEFHRVSPEYQSKNRIPRWEAEPNYGMRREGPPPGAPGGPGGAGAARPPVTPLRGRAALVQGLEGLPIVKPPYGVMAAIDVNKGDLMWQVPHGDTPDVIRNHPLLKGMNIGKTGQSGSVGVLVTKTLVIAGDPSVSTTPTRTTRGAMLRAYDKKTGAQVGEVHMPAQITGHPMTYSVDGRQYIVVAVSGGNYTGEFISFAVPMTETRPTTRAGQ